MKNEKRTIYIGDCGTSSVAVFEGSTITVLRSGGCPVAHILRGVRNYSDPQRLANVVLARWMCGYDGDPHESGLFVEISSHGSALATARA